MKKILNRLFEHQKLSREEAREVLVNITQDTYNPAQVAAFMTVYLMRSVSVEELRGFRDAMMDLCVGIDFTNHKTIDLCGTGGDGKNTFNVSTLAAVVVAGAGYKVAKHGNYGVSSLCGSSNVLEHLGYNFTKDKTVLQKQLDQSNICFLHAPLFHPAMKSVAPIRRDLGVKTFFNMLGPLVNPARPTHQSTGVYNLHLARLYSFLLEETRENFSVVHALDGYDEVSLTGKVKNLTQNGEEMLSPVDFGYSTLRQEQLHGGNTIDEAATIFKSVLGGRGTEAQNHAVTANAALAIKCFEPHKSIADCTQIAMESLKSGSAEQRFAQLV